MTREFYLLSIIPNQQARLKLQTLRQRLFQEHGLASALAFEPVIPLAWFETPVDSGRYARFSTGEDSTGGGQQLPDTPRIELGDPMLWAGHLYISVVVRPEKLLRKLILAAGQAPVPASPIPEGDSPSIPEGSTPPIPAAEGIFLTANEPEITKAVKAEAEYRGRAKLLYTAANHIAQLTEHFSADRSLESTRIGMYSLRFGPTGDSVAELEPAFRRWWKHVEWTLEWRIQLKRTE